MKLTRAIFVFTALAALVAGTSGRADDKPAAAKHNSVAISVRATVIKTETGKPTGDRKNQVPQYGFASNFAHYGFQVESRVPTIWDANLKKDGITVVAPAPPPKPGEKPPEKKDDKTAGPDFVIEGTIELEYRPLKFWDDSRELAIIYVEIVKVSVKDSTGKEIKAISWQDTWGANNEKGHEYVLKECEKRAACFLLNDLFHVKEIADQIPEAKRDEFTKFMAGEDDYRAKNFDDATKKKSAPDPKGDDGKK
jgi:hypothetical protein